MLPVLGLLLLCACRAEPVVEPGAKMTEAWRGPAVTTRWRADRALLIELVAPAAGHHLGLGDVAVHGDLADVHLTYTTPAADELVAQVVTPLQVVVPAVDLPAGVQLVHVHVATWQRGVHYIVAPAPELAAVARRR